MDPNLKTTVFISYAHSDGAALARRLHDDLKASGYDVWFDHSRLTAGANWSTAIEQAVDGRDVLLALMSPASFASDICRGEQLRALRMGKRVIPLLQADSTDRPLFLESKQYISFAALGSYPDAYGQLLAAIADVDGATLAAKYQQTYVTAPRLPARVVSRVEVLDSLRESILKDDCPTKIAVVALIGMGGAGKTTLAQMLCHDRAIQDAFPDGVIWVRLGQESFDLVAQMREVGRALGDDPEHYDTAEGASNRLRTILRKRGALIVLDDVWKLGHVEPFLAEAPASCLLITTTKHDIPVSLEATPVPVGMLSETQSLDVLARWTNLTRDNLPAEAKLIVSGCGRLPLALSMIGGLVRTGLLRRRPNAWVAVLNRLKEAQLDRIRFPLENYPYPELQKAIQVSVDALDPDLRERYLKMCVFPDDTPVSERTFETLWGVDQYEVADTVDGWLNASLAQRDDAGRIILHDLQLDFVRKLAGEQITALHQQVVDRYADVCGTNWSTGPDDGYFFQHLAWNMAGARNWRALSALLLDPAFIRASLEAKAMSYVELKQDFQWRKECLAAIDNLDDRELFTALNTRVGDLYSFFPRRAATAVIEDWLERKDSECLMVTGMGGTGKTMLLKDLWVRHFRDAVFIEISIARPAPFPGELARGILSFLLGSTQPRLEEDAGREHVFSHVYEVVRRSDRQFYMLIDAVDELPSGDIRDLLPFLRELSKLKVRFVLSGRSSLQSELFVVSLPNVQILSLDVMSAQETRGLLQKLMGDRFSELPESTIEKLVERSGGHPLYIKLVSELLKNGTRPEDLLEQTDPALSLEESLRRAHARIIQAGVPDELLRGVAAQLADERSADWEQLRRSFPVPDSLLATLKDSGLFCIETQESRHLVKAAHPVVLKFLRTHYQLIGG